MEVQPAQRIRLWMRLRLLAGLFFCIQRQLAHAMVTTAKKDLRYGDKMAVSLNFAATFAEVETQAM